MSDAPSGPNSRVKWLRPLSEPGEAQELRADAVPYARRLARRDGAGEVVRPPRHDRAGQVVAERPEEMVNTADHRAHMAELPCGMRRALPVVSAAVTAAAVLAGTWYVGRTSSPATIEVVTQPADAAPQPAGASPTATPTATPAPAASPPPPSRTTTRDAAAHACVSGFDVAIDAGLLWDTNTALEDADDLNHTVKALPPGKLRAALQALAEQLPSLATRDVDWDDPVAAERDDPSEEIASLLEDLREECDARFPG